MQQTNPKRKSVTDKYRNKNKELCVQRAVSSHKKKPEYYTAKAMAWQKVNPDKVKVIRDRSYINNRGTEIARVRRRQMIIRGANHLSAADRAEIEGMYQFCKIFKGHEVDHIIPLTHPKVSGLHVPDNLQVLTVAQNRSKGNKFDLEKYNG